MARSRKYPNSAISHLLCTLRDQLAEMAFVGYRLPVTAILQNKMLSSGAYTLPDAARLLGLPLARLRWWVRGALLKQEHAEAGHTRRFPAGPFITQSDGRDRHFDFLTLIEIFTIAQLRSHGVSMSTLRKVREELSQRYHTEHPFALSGLLTDGKRLIKELGDEILLELGSGGQTAFESVLEPFCHRLDFDTATQLATRFFPAGRSKSIVVDPRHSFGRPIITGTNVTTESIASLLRGGERIENLAGDFRLDPNQVREAWDFEMQFAA